MVKGPKGGQVTVDTREIGTLPLDAPLELAPGVHRVAVVHNGRTAFALEIDLDRAEARTLDATLYMSVQRKVGWGLLGAGAAGLITGGVLTGVALDAQSRAQAIDQKRVGEDTSITEAEFAEYLDLRDRRESRARSANSVRVAPGHPDDYYMIKFRDGTLRLTETNCLKTFTISSTRKYTCKPMSILA